MRIAVNTRLLIKDKLDGIGWFSYESLKRITQKHTEHQFIFIFDRPFDESFIFSNNIIPVKIAPQSRHPFLWYLWFEISVPKILSKFKADLFFSPDGFLSTKTYIPSVPAIHDINFAHRPEDLPYLVRNYYNYFFPIYALKAKRIITVSEYSKSDISSTYKVNPDKIDVVYNGVNSAYKPLNEETKKQTIEKLTGGSPYFIFIGALHPRKNVARLIKAFDLFRKETALGFKLVIIGDKMFKNQDIEEAFNNMKFKEDIVFTGRQAINELHKILGSAYAMTFVPYFEGFGIPIIEAMACDVPVITSNVTSMPEVGGDAVLLSDPFSVEYIKNCMVKIANDNELRNKLIIKGRERINKFSWDKTADRVWSSLEKSLK
ncbi:MAG: glycosyltransferase [Bacteroidetes bacterium GWA2_30_7]|nr:MAG: glycosyltransferase [Bacteroidetes bacterium GWA2_30_7]